MHVASTKQSRHYVTLHIINLKYCDYSSWTDKAFQHNQAAYWESKFNTALWFLLYTCYIHTLYSPKSCHQSCQFWREALLACIKMWPLIYTHTYAGQLWVSQWRAFNNHPCEREPTNCIYMRSILSVARQYSVCACVCVCLCSTFLPQCPPER